MSKGMKRYSEEQEKRITKTLNYADSTKQIGSGAINLTGLKHDVKTSRSSEWDILVEAKTSAIKPGQAGKRSITFQKSWIKDVQNHAFDMGKSMGIVVFSFDNKEDFYALGSTDFNNLYQAVLDYEELVHKLESRIEELEGGK